RSLPKKEGISDNSRETIRMSHFLAPSDADLGQVIFTSKSTQPKGQVFSKESVYHWLKTGSSQRGRVICLTEKEAERREGWGEMPTEKSLWPVCDVEATQATI